MSDSRSPKLSVIVPCHGQLEALRRSAPPLLADANVEYILVDHDCPDGCGTFARAYWPCARVVDVFEAGTFNRGRALNRGARVATGQWLSFLDPTDIVTECLSTAVSADAADEALLTSMPGAAHEERGHTLLVCRSSVFARAGGYDERVADPEAQERDLRRRLLEQECKVALVPQSFARRPLTDKGLDNPTARYPSWVRWPNPLTIGIVGPGFGDVFRSLQYAYYLQREYALDVSLYPQWHGFRRIDFQVSPLCSRAALVEELQDNLAAARRLPLALECSIEDVYVPDCWPWHFYPLVPTRLRWQGWKDGLHRRIAYQLDGTSHAGQKNPTPAESAEVLRCTPSFDCVSLGKHLSVRQCVEALSVSDLFVGVDSGMMQLAYAVGVPVFLLRGRMDPFVLFKWHGGHHAVHCTDAADFVVKARDFLGLA
jgi:hypothetical protein